MSLRKTVKLGKQCLHTVKFSLQHLCTSKQSTHPVSVGGMFTARKLKDTSYYRCSNAIQRLVHVAVCVATPHADQHTFNESTKSRTLQCRFCMYILCHKRQDTVMGLQLPSEKKHRCRESPYQGHHERYDQCEEAFLQAS